MATPARLSFGKHKGRALAEVLVVDPEYFAWLQAQSDLLQKRPELARGFAELGVTGDHTPLHNAVQTLFLDDGVCRRLAKHLWGPNCVERIRRVFWRERRKRLLAPILEKSEWEYSKETKRTDLVNACRTTRAERKVIDALLSLDDTGLEERYRRRYDEPKSPLRYVYRSDGGETLREKLAKERATLDATLHRYRTDAAKMRGSLIAARTEIQRLDPREVVVGSRIDSRRMEEANGTDVRVQCSLIASAPEGFTGDYPTHWQIDAWIEIKPFVGDDYPAVLRQLDVQRRLAKERYSSGTARFVAVVGRYGGQGATLDQVRQMFREAKFDFVLLSEIDCDLPKIEAPTAASVGELPLFQTAD